MSHDLRRGLTVWLTGLPSSGKSTIARALGKRLVDADHRVEILDGDEVRLYLTADLGFDRRDRIENVRRVGYVANLLSRNGIVVLCPVIAPYREARDEVRRLHGERYFEVYVATPVDICERRDVKGLYARQRAGELTGLTGIDDPYEQPVAPDVVVQVQDESLEESVSTIWWSLTASATQAEPSSAPGQLPGTLEPP